MSHQCESDYHCLVSILNSLDRLINCTCNSSSQVSVESSVHIASSLIIIVLFVFILIILLKLALSSSRVNRLVIEDAAESAVRLCQ